MKLDKKAIWEAVKEVARLALFAAVGAAVAWGTSKLSTLDPNSTFVVIATALLRFADKFVHESKHIEAKGLAPF